MHIKNIKIKPESSPLWKERGILGVLEKGNLPHLQYVKWESWETVGKPVVE